MSLTKDLAFKLKKKKRLLQYNVKNVAADVAMLTPFVVVVGGGGTWWWWLWLWLWWWTEGAG